MYDNIPFMEHDPTNLYNVNPITGEPIDWINPALSGDGGRKIRNRRVCKYEMSRLINQEIDTWRSSYIDSPLLIYTLRGMAFKLSYYYRVGTNAMCVLAKNKEYGNYIVIFSGDSGFREGFKVFRYDNGDIIPDEDKYQPLMQYNYHISYM